MGTNFYIRPKIRPSKIEQIKEAVTEENIYNGNLNTLLNDFEEIHIGKSSAGWQFLFDHNNWKYYKDKKSLCQFIKDIIDDGGTFVDEYDEPISLNEFWDLVESKKDGFDNNSYYLYEVERYKKYKENPELFKDDYFKPHYPQGYRPEIFVDGLRFDTDFC